MTIVIGFYAAIVTNSSTGRPRLSTGTPSALSMPTIAEKAASCLVAICSLVEHGQESVGLAGLLFCASNPALRTSPPVLTGEPLPRTNITEPPRKYATSRGDLVSSFLLPQTPKPTLKGEIDAFLDAHRDDVYAGFNLLVLSPSPSTDHGDLGATGQLSLEGAFLTNHGGGGTITGRMLSEEERHIGGMSNGIEGRGADEWPKVKHGRQALRDLLHGLPQDATEAQIADRLFDLLT